MSQTFDTGLAVPQRTLLRDAVVARLAPLLRSNGLYLDTLAEFGRVLRGSIGEDEAADLVHACGGKWPSVLVALGSKTLTPSGITTARDRYVADVEVHVYFMSKNLRSKLSRVKQDAGSLADNRRDPGVEVMMEHAAVLLAGFQLTDASHTIYQVIPRDEEELDTGEDYTIWHQSYTCRFEQNTKRHKSVSQYVTMLHATFSEEAATLQNPLATIESINP